MNKGSGLTKTTRFKMYKPAQANEDIFIKNNLQITKLITSRANHCYK